MDREAAVATAPQPQLFGMWGVVFEFVIAGLAVFAKASPAERVRGSAMTNARRRDA
jgi:hypothetical protein